MFESKQDAYDHRDRVAREVTSLSPGPDAMHVRATLDGVDLLITGRVGLVRGHLAGSGFGVRDRGETGQDDWHELEVRPS